MKYSLHNVKPYLGMPVNRDLPWQTAMSLMRTVSDLKDRQRPHDFEFVVNGSIIHKTRSILAARFLKTNCTHMFWLDSDISWEVDAFMRILALGTVADVVGAAYPAKMEPTTFLVNISSDKLKTNEHGCFPINGMGLGFTVCKRWVIEAIAKNSPAVKDEDGADLPMTFRTDITQEADGTKFVGEDICFFRDAAKLGAEVWIDPSIMLGHVGGKEYRGRFMDALQRAREVA